MTCSRVQIPGFGTGIICSRTKQRVAPCLYCSVQHVFLCDHRDKPRSRRCSRKLCANHAYAIGDDTHVCPDHVTAQRTEEPLGSRAPLQLFTGNINQHRKDPDAFDVTIMTGGSAGRPFAPSVELFKAARKALADASLKALTDAGEADRIRRASWATYRRAFLAEMLLSADHPVPAGWDDDVRQANRRGVESRPEAWAALLARKRVVLLCYCATRETCHRGLLASILVRMGAEDKGELAPPEDARQVKLFETT